MAGSAAAFDPAIAVPGQLLRYLRTWQQAPGTGFVPGIPVAADLVSWLKPVTIQPQAGNAVDG